MVKLKIICDSECNVFIDGGFVTRCKANQISIIPLERGEYIIRFECVAIPELYVESDFNMEYDKIERLSFHSMLKDNLDLLNKVKIEPYRGANGLFGFKIKDTDFDIIPCLYDTAESFCSLSFSGNADYSIVSQNGKFGAITIKNDILVPIIYSRIWKIREMILVGEKEEEYYYYTYRGYLIGHSKVGYDPLYSLITFHDFYVAKDDLTGCGTVFCFYSGKKIDGFENIGIDRAFCRLGWGASELYASHYYLTFEKDKGEGIVMIDGVHERIQWIIHCFLEKINYSDGENHDPFVSDYKYFDEYERYTYYDQEEKLLYWFTYYRDLKLLVAKRATKKKDIYAPQLEKIVFLGGDEFVPMEPEPEYYDVVIFDEFGNPLFRKHNIDIGKFRQGVASLGIKGDEKEYRINSKMKIFGPFDFETGYFDALAVIRENNKYGLLDTDGRIVVPCKYDNMEWIERFNVEIHDGDPIHSDLFWVEKDGLRGVYSLKKDAEILPCEYDSVEILDGIVKCNKADVCETYDYEGRILR